MNYKTYVTNCLKGINSKGNLLKNETKIVYGTRANGMMYILTFGDSFCIKSNDEKLTSPKYHDMTD